ncbi:co-chaperone GroES [Geobacter sp.]|uniref:co-chaperone GroES n=1 Tax=Geobacter sp. TaxID=46610 RepID=UPI0027BA68E6|nr:co-chaperone GroES [Geobacter sp.]
MAAKTAAKAAAKSKLIPLADRIVITPLKQDEVTASGLVIPDTAKEKPQRGEIVAVGNGKKTEDGKVIPIDLKVGDKVLFGKYAGTDIKVEGQDYLIMREDDILGVIE